MLSLIIVEDEKDIREGIRDGVDWKSYGIEIAGDAPNGREALELLKTKPVDIVITDVVMPFLSGIEFVRDLRELGLDPEIIFISGYQDLEYLKSAFKLEAVDYLFKPVDMDELDAVLKRTVESRKMILNARGTIAGTADRGGGDTHNYLHVDFRMSEEIAEAVRRGDTDGTRKALKRFIEAVRVQGPRDLTLVRDLFIGVVIAVNKILASGEAGDPVHWEPLHSIRSFGTMAEWLRVNVNGAANRMQYLRQSRSSLLVERMKKEIGMRISGEISTQLLSGIFHLTPNYISRLFRQETGATFHEYVTTVRLNTAIRLLADPSKKLYEIAHEVGYRDADYFTKVFKKRFGRSPKDYRNEVLE